MGDSRASDDESDGGGETYVDAVERVTGEREEREDVAYVLQRSVRSSRALYLILYLRAL